MASALGTTSRRNFSAVMVTAGMFRLGVAGAVFAFKREKMPPLAGSFGASDLGDRGMGSLRSGQCAGPALAQGPTGLVQVRHSLCVSSGRVFGVPERGGEMAVFLDDDQTA